MSQELGKLRKQLEDARADNVQLYEKVSITALRGLLISWATFEFKLGIEQCVKL